ncbi:hypothetical protein EON64_14560 [archaeon]|nr:MAG: hypothetical protein EON64_14560 [archaeon]
MKANEVLSINDGDEVAAPPSSVNDIPPPSKYPAIIAALKVLTNDLAVLRPQARRDASTQETAQCTRVWLL